MSNIRYRSADILVESVVWTAAIGTQLASPFALKSDSVEVCLVAEMLTPTRQQAKDAQHFELRKGIERMLEFLDPHIYEDDEPAPTAQEILDEIALYDRTRHLFPAGIALSNFRGSR